MSGWCRFRPGERMEDVGIVRVAARESAEGKSGGQVMVRVWNQSNRKRATLRVETGGEPKTVEVDLPEQGGRGGSGIILWRWGHWGRKLRARLVGGDALEADDVAWLVRKRSWPRLEARTGLPAELRRMIEAYAAQQPAGANGKRGWRSAWEAGSWRAMSRPCGWGRGSGPTTRVGRGTGPGASHCTSR